MNCTVMRCETTSSYSNTRNNKKTTPKHIIIRFLKTNNKEKTLKSSKRKKIHYVQKIKEKDNSRLPIRNNEN